MLQFCSPTYRQPKFLLTLFRCAMLLLLQRQKSVLKWRSELIEARGKQFGRLMSMSMFLLDMERKETPTKRHDQDHWELRITKSYR